MLTTQQIIKKYGKASANPNYLVVIDLPYPMRLAWDKSKTVKKMRCHRLVADKFKTIFQQILDAYGFEQIKDLGIDLFGGCFNYRPMRGGSSLSRHSWGIAIDLHPEANGLKTKWEDSLFAKPEYAKLLQIFEQNGFLNYGKVKGFDAMHFECKR
jgi:hypothetical protein